MRAIVQTGFGPPERVLEPAEIDPPQVGEDDVLIRVRATSVNTPDWISVAGVPYVLRVRFRGSTSNSRQAHGGQYVTTSRSSPPSGPSAIWAIHERPCSEMHPHSSHVSKAAA
jgi:hypothetical protein